MRGGIGTMTTDAEIFEAATRIFREKGYHAASMQDIAEAVGLLKGSLYHHISSKHELLLEIFEAGMQEATRAIEEIAYADLAPADKLRLAITRHIELITGNLDQATVFVMEARAMELEQRQRVVAQRDYFDRLFRRIIQEGVDAGVFRPIDATLVTFALMGMHNWLILWYRRDGRLSPQEIAAIFVDLVLNGLLLEA
jgi:AcrR family transcriptional regulator